MQDWEKGKEEEARGELIDVRNRLEAGQIFERTYMRGNMPLVVI